MEDYRSEPIPDFMTSTAMVRKIVGRDWKETINDETKDVFVAYISSHCRSCKEMEEDWNLLAASTPTDLLIGKMNMDLNDAEGLELPKGHYPKLIFYPKNNKKGIVYKFDRDIESFQEFLSQNLDAYRATGATDAE